MAVKVKMNRAGMAALLTSSGVAAEMQRRAQPIAAAARRDPNRDYSASVTVTSHVSRGRSPRASARVGVAPVLGLRVESERGTLSRAVGGA